jgi:phosphatidylglycerol:prolipoprotein diacylglycerol transferase
VTHDVRYPLIMLAALATCSLLLRRTQARLPLVWWQKMGIGIGAFCGAMVGAKLPFVFLDWDRFLDGSAWLSDGKTIMCGIIGGYLGVEIAKWTMEIRVKTGDTFAVPCAVAVAIGRIACFVGGCCFGKPTNRPWGVVFPTSGDLLPRHPTQLYEAAFHLAVAGMLLLFQSRGLFRGQLIKLYILIYLGYRFLTEFIRPETTLELGLTVYQWAALAMMPVFAALWWRDARSTSHLSRAT